jgi:hypothetical protein
VQPVAESGAQLDSRYRLDHPVHTRTGNALWRGTDEVLGRPVTIRLVTTASKAQYKDLCAAVSRAGQVSDARWVRVLDVGFNTSGKQVAAWVISEWVDGQSLTSTVRHDPMRGPVATSIILTCAQAVVAAHAAGAHHNLLHPSEVVLTADGQPRLAGLEIATSLAAMDPKPSTPPQYDDTRALGALLYASLTGRWPLPGWDGLPAPSRGDGRHPRQQRGGVSRELDEITARALSGGYDDATGFALDLAALPRAPLHPPPADPQDHRDAAWRRWAWRIVPPLLVAAVGGGAWLVGSDLGKIPSPARAVTPAFPQEHHRGGVPGQQIVWAKAPHITSFDPQGDGAEDPGGVGLAVDDDPSTEWMTDNYRDSPDFGGLKSGAGLLLDLGRAKHVHTADLLFSAPGATVQLRAGNKPPERADDLPVVATRVDSPAATHLALTESVKARYWLVWVTVLPKVGNDYRLGISEIALQH